MHVASNCHKKSYSFAKKFEYINACKSFKINLHNNTMNQLIQLVKGIKEAVINLFSISDIPSVMIGFVGTPDNNPIRSPHVTENMFGTQNNNGLQIYVDDILYEPDDSTLIHIDITANEIPPI